MRTSDVVLLRRATTVGKIVSILSTPTISTAGNKPSTLLLRGPPGCGKTSLATLVMEHVESQLGWDVLAFRGSEFVDFKSSVLTFTTREVSLPTITRDTLLVIDDVQDMYQHDAALQFLSELVRGRLGNTLHVLMTAVYRSDTSGSPIDMAFFEKLPLEDLFVSSTEANMCFEEVLLSRKSSQHPHTADVLRGFKDKFLSLCTTPFGIHLGPMRFLLELCHSMSSRLEPTAIEKEVLTFLGNPLTAKGTRRFFNFDVDGASLPTKERNDWILILRSAGPVRVSQLQSGTTHNTIARALRAGFLFRADGSNELCVMSDRKSVV